MSESAVEAVAVEKSDKAPKTNGKAKKAPKSAKGSLTEGSTRLRLFRALAKYPKGLSASEIKEKTGMLPNSGHLAVLLGEEQAAKRIRCEVHEPQDGGREVNQYLLLAQGKKDFETGNIDLRKSSGRVGTLWTKARRVATPKAPKTGKKAPKKAKAAK